MKIKCRPRAVVQELNKYFCSFQQEGSWARTAQLGTMSTLLLLFLHGPALASRHGFRYAQMEVVFALLPLLPVSSPPAAAWVQLEAGQPFLSSPLAGSMPMLQPGSGVWGRNDGNAGAASSCPDPMLFFSGQPQHGLGQKQSLPFVWDRSSGSSGQAYNYQPLA